MTKIPESVQDYYKDDFKNQNILDNVSIVRLGGLTNQNYLLHINTNWYY